MTLGRILTIVLLSLAAGAVVSCTRRPVDYAKLDTELLRSARKGDTAAVQHLLQQGAHIEAKDQGGSTAVALAADYGHPDTVRLLLEKGADSIAGGLSGEGALTEAVRIGYTTKVALVLERGVDPKTKNEALFIMGESGPVVLQMPTPARPVQAQQNQERPDIDCAKTVGLLLDHGANIEARNEEDDTPLMWAAEHGQTDVVRALLERGADVEARNKYGSTALVLAACECAVIDMPETLESMKVLLGKGAKVNAKDKAFARTEELYRLAGAAAKLKRK